MTRSCPRQGKVAPSGDERSSSPSAEGWFCGFKTIQPPCRLGNSTHPRNFKKQKFPTFGMIQQERQNNIINILGGHSYAM